MVDDSSSINNLWKAASVGRENERNKVNGRSQLIEMVTLSAPVQVKANDETVTELALC